MHKTTRPSGKSKSSCSASERRRQQRLDVSLPMRCVLPARYAIAAGRILTNNVSGGGACISLNRPVTKGVKIKISLYFPGERRPVVSLSRVMWCRPETSKDGRASYKVGIEYVKIARKDRGRFLLLYCELMVNYFMSLDRFLYLKGQAQWI